MVSTDKARVAARQLGPDSQVSSAMVVQMDSATFRNHRDVESRPPVGQLQPPDPLEPAGYSRNVIEASRDGKLSGGPHPQGER